MEFVILGGVEARVGGRRVDLHARQRGVLAILLVEAGRRVTVDDLVDRLWDGAPPRASRETIYTYLSRLRHLLGGVPIVRTGGGYVLDIEPTAVDMHRFQHLVSEARAADDAGASIGLWNRALALWRGEPFKDLDLPWLNGVRDTLVNQHLSAFLDRNDLWLRRGDHDRLLPELATAAAAHPLNERLAGQLMLALYRSGRQADALAHYTRLRQRLVEQLGCDPSPALQHLHRRLLGADSSLAPPDEAMSPQMLSSGTHVVPANLPLDPPGFVGRRNEMDLLDRLLAVQAPVVAVSGSGGVGKTTLAVHWAHQNRDAFPDGQLYLDLRGFDPASPALDPSQALQALLELLGVPAERIPTSVEARMGHYRSRLAGKRVLVLLDNARDAAQVRPLLPSRSGSMAVVTSRSTLTGLIVAEGARPVSLDVLDEDEARQLLAARLGAERLSSEPRAVTEILAACAGLPLALAIAAARAATSPGFPLLAIARDLADTPRQLDTLATQDLTTDIRAVFSASYQALRPQTARLFRILGLCPGPDISLDAAACMAAMPVERVARLCAELAEARLLAESVPGRYTLPYLARSYAGELARSVDSEPELHAVRARMIGYYTSIEHGAAPQHSVMAVIGTGSATHPFRCGQ
ncbi:AfsR/SARP family transcriptional regulator [Nonomuraea sp. NPDC050202]|uniref:AfsR/SARP family transcriptional regulator n=1 Tax=Nonomuraea sp. NPDC050202 TaxID=3155035 RepID=UPI0033F52492